MKSKKPILSSVFIALIPVMFLTISGVIISICKLNETQALAAQVTAFILSLSVGLLIVKKSGITFRRIGFCIPEKGSSKAVFYYIPLVLSLLVIIIPGFGGYYDTARIFYIAVLTIFVGITEELYFRGIVFQNLKCAGLKKTILISSLLFGFLHLPNILSADFSPAYIILQITFAFTFGVLATEIVAITKSLIPVILWHFLHNFTILTIKPDFELDTVSIIIHSVQLLIMIIFTIIFWKKIHVFELKRQSPQ